MEKSPLLSFLTYLRLKIHSITTYYSKSLRNMAFVEVAYNGTKATYAIEK